MKKKIASAVAAGTVALGLALVGLTPAQAASTLPSSDKMYGIGYDGSSVALDSIAISGDKALTSLIGNTGAPATGAPTLGATYNDVDGFAYGVTPGPGYFIYSRIDVATGTFTELGTTTSGNFGLECTPDGSCYTLDPDNGSYGSLAKIDFSNGVSFSDIGAGAGLTTNDDLTFAYDPVSHTMYALTYQTGVEWFTVDLTTGVFTPISLPDGGSCPVAGIYDAAFDSSGTLWISGADGTCTWTPGAAAISSAFPYVLATDGTTPSLEFGNFVVTAKPALPDTGVSTEAGLWTGVAAAVLLAAGLGALMLVRRKARAQA